VSHHTTIWKNSEFQVFYTIEYALSDDMLRIYLVFIVVEINVKKYTFSSASKTGVNLLNYPVLSPPA